MKTCSHLHGSAAGGFIFPLFMAGAALGRGLAQIRGIPFISDVPPVLLSMSIATGAQGARVRVSVRVNVRVPDHGAESLELDQPIKTLLTKKMS